MVCVKALSWFESLDIELETIILTEAFYQGGCQVKEGEDNSLK